jgi:hypothetical protein
MDRRIIAVSFLTLLLCASTAWGRMNALVVGGGVVQSTTRTAIITQDTDDGGTSPVDPNTYTVGQSFTMPAGETEIYSIELFVHAAGTDVTLILDDDTDLSADTIGSVTKSISGTGYVEFVFNVTGLTAGNTYYFGINKNSTTTDFRRATTSVISGSAYMYSSSSYLLTSTLTHDFRFKVNK